MKLKLLICSLFTLFLFLALIKSPVQAYELSKNHRVKVYFLIPKNYQSIFTGDVLNNSKRSAISALQEVKGWFADKADGATFDLDTNVYVVNSPYTLDMRVGRFADQGFSMVDGYNLIPSEAGTITVVFTIGTGDKAGSYAGDGISGGWVLLSHVALADLGNSNWKNFTEGVLAHEIGHGLGLVQSDYSDWHPCSRISASLECINKNGVYPPPDEYGKDLMGVGYANFPNSLLHNTLYNPLICKLFSELKGASCPFDTPNTAEPISSGGSGGTALGITGFNPILVDPATDGQLLIMGRGFGSTGKVSLFFLGEEDIDYAQVMTSGAGFRILNWSDTAVTIDISPVNYTQDTHWGIEITNQDSSSPYYDKAYWNDYNNGNPLTIRGLNGPTSEGIIDIHMFCGSPRQEMNRGGWGVKFIRQNISGGETIIQQFKADTNWPNKSVRLSIDYRDYQTGDKYFVRADDYGGTPPQQNNLLINDSYPTSSFSKMFIFNYPNCVTYAPKPIQFISINGKTWDDYFNSSFNLNLTDLGASEGNPGIYTVPVQVIYADGSDPKTVNITFNYQPIVNPPPGEGGEPTPPPGCQRARDPYNQCGRGDECSPDGTHLYRVTQYTNDSCGEHEAFSCQDLGSAATCGGDGGTTCQVERQYNQCGRGDDCSPESDHLYQVKQYNSDTCGDYGAYTCRDLGSATTCGGGGGGNCNVVREYPECGGNSSCSPEANQVYWVQEYDSETCGEHGRFTCRQTGQSC